MRRAGVAIYVRNVVRCGSRVKKGSWNQPTPPRHPVCQCIDGRSGAADVALHAEHDGRSGRDLTLRKSLHTSGLPAAAAMAAAATLLTVGVDEGDGPAPRQPPQSRCEPRQRAATGAGKDVRRSVPIQTRFLFGRSDRGVDATAPGRLIPLTLTRVWGSFFTEVPGRTRSKARLSGSLIGHL